MKKDEEEIFKNEEDDKRENDRMERGETVEDERKMLR